jgi:hypothetical protein
MKLCEECKWFDYSPYPKEPDLARCNHYRSSYFYAKTNRLLGRIGAWLTGTCGKR